MCRLTGTGPKRIVHLAWLCSCGFLVGRVAGAMLPELPVAGPSAQGDLVMGKDHVEPNYETSVLQFSVAQADMGKYVYFSATASHPLACFIVRGDRGGYKGDYRWWDQQEQSLLVARVIDPYVNPEMEFRVFAAGSYTLVLKSHLAEAPPFWRQAYVAPPGMSVSYSLLTATTSQARARGKSVYVLKSTFPPQFEIGGQSVDKSLFDFAGYQAALNTVFQKYVEFFGYDYTKYGTMIGVRYPGDPDYPYGGDATNPMNVKLYVPLEDVAAPSVFTHELGHVFTQAYPFVYSFGSANNVEAGANYLRDWLADPNGGGGLTAEKFIRFQAEMMVTLRDISPSTPWHEAVVKDGFLLLVKNLSGGWTGIRTVFQDYALNYTGNGGGINGYGNAEEFYLRLAESIPQEQRRTALYGQLGYWRCPFAPDVAFLDDDHDGFVSGIDPDDDDALVNPYSYEFLDDGVDNNLNGYVDELVLKSAGETLTLGDDNTAYGEDRGTRRRTLLKKGEIIRITALTAGKPARIGIYRGNIWQSGPEWWFASEYPLMVESATSVAPSLTFEVKTTGVYTISFTGYKRDGVNVGDAISYSVQRTSPRASR